jgi:hypothetical protein
MQSPTTINTTIGREAKQLRAVWYSVWQQKESYIDKAAKANMLPEQKAEVDLKLAELTGELKRIDAAIHELYYPQTYLPQTAALSLLRIVELRNKRSDANYIKAIAKQRTAIKKLEDKNSALRATNLYLKQLGYNYKSLTKKFLLQNQTN